MATTIPSSVVDALLALSAPEKIALIGVLWDSINDGEGLPLPAWQVEELNRREAVDEENPEDSVTWEEALQRIKGAQSK